MGNLLSDANDRNAQRIRGGATEVEVPVITPGTTAAAPAQNVASGEQDGLDVISADDLGMQEEAPEHPAEKHRFGLFNRNKDKGGRSRGQGPWQLAERGSWRTGTRALILTPGRAAPPRAVAFALSRMFLPRRRSLPMRATRQVPHLSLT